MCHVVRGTAEKSIEFDQLLLIISSRPNNRKFNEHSMNHETRQMNATPVYVGLLRDVALALILGGGP